VRTLGGGTGEDVGRVVVKTKGKRGDVSDKIRELLPILCCVSMCCKMKMSMICAWTAM
jgi:hypothetical protein